MVFIYNRRKLFFTKEILFTFLEFYIKIFLYLCILVEMKHILRNVHKILLTALRIKYNSSVLSCRKIENGERRFYLKIILTKNPLMDIYFIYLEINYSSYSKVLPRMNYSKDRFYLDISESI